MCGIIGINSSKPVSATIVNSLKKLEYRGYDSAGIATLSDGLINEVKSRKMLTLKKIYEENMVAIGIGHVRCYHGLPNSINAHPHHTKCICST